MIKYVCLLRGINVGGNKKVPMTDLKQMFGSLGFTDVKTLLNSGNVVFEAGDLIKDRLTDSLEAEFRRTFGFDSRMTVRSLSEIEKLISLDPFRNIQVTKDVCLYVTFLRESTESALSLPYASPEGDFQILARSEQEIFSALTVKTARSVDAMAFLEKEFGKDITTRNWNTVVKIAAL